MSSLLPTVTAPIAWALLITELAIASGLIVGMFVVRAGHVRAHRAIQSSMVLLNIPIVLILMLPAYLDYVLPGLPGSLGQSFYLFPTLMLIAGSTAEALGIYILLVAGTNWLPERLRFRHYKIWMRTELILWWAVVFAGIATYYIWWVQA
ncbi:MAG: hypothetical protein L3J68_01980 [Thermoplasmata archaeon]|nr:hypothetical protein [Thermoplasmata archaeon]